jgi:hypothetical protein
MYLIQILLPLRDNDGIALDKFKYDGVRKYLTNRFGGVTIYMRAPASGIWKEDGEEVRDEIVIFEVMAEDVDREFWRSYLVELQDVFRQEVIVVRAQRIEVL